MEMSSTPSRPISREHFESLRQKVVEESPKLYKNKVLSDPTYRSTSLFKSEHASQNDLGSTLVNGKGTADDLVREREELTDELGNFESPILQKLAKRTVNKEHETQTIVINLVALAIWDLLAKFLKLFIDYTKGGEKLIAYLQDKQAKNHFMTWKRYLHLHFPCVVDWFSWSNLDTFLHLVVVYNVVISLWRLFSKVRVDDLNLTQYQKELLGLNVNDGFLKSKRDSLVKPSSRITKPHLVFDQRDSKYKANTNPTSNPASIPSTPYLFKSLETPLKRRQQEEQNRQHPQNQHIDLHRNAQSAFVSKVNAFGSLKNHFTEPRSTNDFKTPAGRTGYIPSNKYAYMINSPCPRKKI